MTATCRDSYSHSGCHRHRHRQLAIIVTQVPSQIICLMGAISPGTDGKRMGNEDGEKRRGVRVRGEDTDAEFSDNKAIDLFVTSKGHSIIL